VIFSGDTVMDGGIGRTDFPGGDFDLLATGIREKILTLPGDFRIFPGHGGVSTVAEELRGNAFIR
jgi:glyoxylase-like metal-dependent hydrolase (beta-lactamase superfamily II)